MGKNADFVSNMDKMMTRWDREVDQLARTAAMGAGGADAAYQDGVKELRTCREAAQKAFQEIRFASESEGLQLKEGMQAAWLAMQGTLEKVSAGLAKK